MILKGNGKHIQYYSPSKTQKKVKCDDYDCVTKPVSTPTQQAPSHRAAEQDIYVDNSIHG